MKIDSRTMRVTDKGKLGSWALTIGLVGLAISAGGYLSEPKQFFYSYLVAFIFWLSVGLGGLFFTLLHHLVKAEWSTVLRRLSESAMATLPIMAVFVIPVLLGIHDLYHWSHADVVAKDHILMGKASYLNTPFFVIRTVAYFLIWTVLALLLGRTSIKQDTNPTEALSLRLRRISAPGMILFALTSTFAAFDWLMSLDAHWYSTIFGLYLFSGNFLLIMCFMVLIALYLRRQGILKTQITVEHYHDLGKLIFGFIVFWAYMAFSQYMLMWYANIPEETVWFHFRWYSDWRPLSFVLIFGHFAIPFLVLITRAAKRNLTLLGFMAVWILIVRWADLHWLTLPNLYREGPQYSWMDISTLAGIGGIVVWAFWRKLTAHPLLPTGDPTLNKSIEFQNT